MKKLFTIIALALVSMVSMAQTNPQRLLVCDTNGGVTGFLAERIDSIYFEKIEGKVAADVEFISYEETDEGPTITLSVARTPDCVGFKIECMPKIRAEMFMDPLVADSYFKSSGSQAYYEDFTNAKMTGMQMEFIQNAEYSLVTLGYDKYGVACEVRRADFKTPKPDVVGNPSVTYTVDGVTGTTVTMTFTPNADCAEYGICLMEAGSAEAYFEQWGAVMGFASIENMILSWSRSKYTSSYTNTWDELLPGMDYSVYVVPIDVNGAYGDMVICPVTTIAQGGEGEAKVDITIGDFGGDATNGYWQYVCYTPNSETSVYHSLLVQKSYVDDGTYSESWIETYLTGDDNSLYPGDPYWNQYAVDNAPWGVNPATEYMAFARAKNINGEWGPMAKVTFTTPSATAAPAHKAPAFGKRNVKKVGTINYREQMEQLNRIKAKKAGVQLIQK